LVLVETVLRSLRAVWINGAFFDCLSQSSILKAKAL